MFRRLRSSKKEPNLWHNNLFLLLSILILFILGPAFEVIHNSPIISSIFFSILIISGRGVLNFTDSNRLKMDLLGLSCLLFLWVGHFIKLEILEIIFFYLLSIYLFITTILLIYHVAKSKTVNTDIIFCSINGYMLLGVLGAIAFKLVEMTNTGSLSIDIASKGNFDSFVYLSFVSLSTVGYGDITPVIPASRAIAILLCITGQLYLTILIALLVGKFLSSSMEKK